MYLWLAVSSWDVSIGQNDIKLGDVIRRVRQSWWRRWRGWRWCWWLWWWMWWCWWRMWSWKRFQQSWWGWWWCWWRWRSIMMMKTQLTIMKDLCQWQTWFQRVNVVTICNLPHCAVWYSKRVSRCFTIIRVFVVDIMLVKDLSQGLWWQI